MFIFTAKLSKRKLAAAVVAAGVLLVVIIVLLSIGKSEPRAGAAAASGRPSDKNIVTNADRVRFLGEYNWEVDEQPLEFEEVLIPSEFDDVLNGYNELQKSQGYDLSKYKNKRVMRYSYNVRNYPNVSDNVRANLLIYKDTVIGADVCSATQDGFMHGLTKQ